jgi:hypothetical protein
LAKKPSISKPRLLSQGLASSRSSCPTK